VKSPRMARPVTLALVAAVAGCSSINPRFYTLDSTATASGSPPTRTIVTVEPVAVPASVDQPQLVLQVGPNRVEVEEFDRWAEPLEDGIAHAVAGDLSVLLASPNVTTASLASLTPDYVVTINVQRFESVKGQSAELDAVWVVRGKAGGKTRSGRTVAHKVVHGEGFDALAAAHSRAIAQLSQDIAVAIRTEADENFRTEAGSNTH
jgi:uncharacterized lipoprotein YmbA